MEPQLMMIVPESEIKTDKEFIQEIIIMKAKEYRVDPAIALKIAECESSFNTNAFNPSNNDGSHDSGLYQINSIHSKTVQSLGLDVKNNVYDNIEYAMILMSEEGTQPWYSSQHCWGKA